MRLIIREVTQVFILVLLVSFFSFFILYFLPGSSEQIRTGIETSGKSLSVGNNAYSMDMFSQSNSIYDGMLLYIQWIKNVLQGDWGTSEYTQESVMSILNSRWGITLTIAFFSVIITITIAIVWCRAVDLLSSKKKHITAKIVLGILKNVELILLSCIPLSLSLIVLSVVSALHISLIELQGANILILPLIVLVFLQLPIYVRSLRTSLVQVSKNKFVSFSYSQGFSHRWVWYRDILPNAFLFTLTLSIVQLSYLIGGTIIVEKIFLIPGIGSKLVDAVMSRDRQVVQAIVVLVAIMVGIFYSISTILRQLIYGIHNE